MTGKLVGNLEDLEDQLIIIDFFRIEEFKSKFLGKINQNTYKI